MSTAPATSAGAALLARRLDVLTGALWSEIGALSSLVESRLGAGATRRAELAIEEHSRALILAGGGRVAGAGFVAAPGLLADAPYWLEWWLGDERDGVTTCRRLAAETDPTALGFRDYTELPWYAAPRETDADHVTGPYVDYVCTDQHTLTFTRPVHVEGRFAGIVGADVLTAWIERTLAAELAACTRACVVVNAGGRVVVASESTWVVGDLVRDHAGTSWGAVPCRNAPLRVLEEPHEP